MNEAVRVCASGSAMGSWSSSGESLHVTSCSARSYLLANVRNPANASTSFCSMSANVGILTGDDLRPGKLCLTWSGFQFVNWSSTEADFAFVFRDGLAVRVQSILAEFLSPKISRIRRSDSCADRYVFKDGSTRVCKALAELVSCLRQGKPLDIDKSNFEELVQVSYELENDEILSSLLTLAYCDIEKALCMIRCGTIGARCEALVNFVAAHFHEISDEGLRAMDVETARLLLSHKSLRIQSEDKLYDFVRSRADRDSRFVCLFEFVCFEYLSDNRIKDFVSFVNEQIFAEFNMDIWHRISRRLMQSVTQKGTRVASIDQRGPELPMLSEFTYHAERPLDGMIAYLERKCRSLGAKKAVEITKGDDWQRKGPGEPGTDSQSDAGFGLMSQVMCDFKEWQVTPRSYSIRSKQRGPGSCHPKSWVFEVSNDGNTWEIIDRRENSNDLNGSHMTHNFSISPEPLGRFRFVRLRLIGRNHAGGHRFHLDSVEVFGTLHKQ